MPHVLDNPAFNALISQNSNFANGTHEVKYFPREVSPFVAFNTNTEKNFNTLHQITLHDKPVILISPNEIELPPQWKLLRSMHGFQMLYTGATIPEPEIKAGIVPLRDEHIPQMLSLTQLTQPGPFDERTIDFGHYQGVFEGDQLVAMAGQRLHAFNYAEVSAVCTHPDHLGKGYARQLLVQQINRIVAASETPFLHVRHDNHRAIKVYESLGFATRREIFFYVMTKAE